MIYTTGPWKIASFVALSFGLALTAWLISAVSLSAVMQSLAKVGWGAAAVVAVRATMIAINGLAWSKLLVKLSHAPTRAFLLARWVREAVDVLLPAAYIGGGLVGARLLTFWRMPLPIAFAGAIADLFLQTFAQALFALVGAGLLLRLIGPRMVLPELILGVVVAGAALGGFYAVQRFGGARLIDRIVEALSPRTASVAQTTPAGFQAAMEAIWSGRRSSAVLTLLMHFFAWSLGTLEVWSALYFMESPITLERAVIIESLGVSISIAAFVVPGSWGIQEAGYMLIGRMLGVPGELALTLSLVKRIPDFLLGIPGLLIWYMFEARRFLFKRSRGVGGAPPA